MATDMGMSGPESERGLAAVAYILTWITGLIILLTAKKDEKFKRWHAIQAIGLGIILVVFYIVFNVVIGGIVMGSAATGSTAGFGMAFIFGSLIWILTLILVIWMAVSAYQGKKVRIPIVAGFADKNA